MWKKLLLKILAVRAFEMIQLTSLLRSTYSAIWITCWMIFICTYFLMLLKTSFRRKKKSIKSNNCLPDASKYRWRQERLYMKIMKAARHNAKYIFFPLFRHLMRTIKCLFVWQYNWKKEEFLYTAKKMYNVKCNWQQNHLFLFFLYENDISSHSPFNNIHSYKGGSLFTSIHRNLLIVFYVNHSSPKFLIMISALLDLQVLNDQSKN